MKTLEEKIAVMQWALENPEKDIEYNGFSLLAKNASWDWSIYNYSIPSKYQIAPGHNPDKLTVEQVGEGWRLLSYDEVAYRSSAFITNVYHAWSSFSKKWIDVDTNNISVVGSYRTQKPEGYFLPKEPQYRDWTIAEVPLRWWFKNKYSGVIETIARCYPDKTHPFTLCGESWSPAGLRQHWLCTSSNTPLAPDTVWSVCGVEVKNG